MRSAHRTLLNQSDWVFDTLANLGGAFTCRRVSCSSSRQFSSLLMCDPNEPRYLEVSDEDEFCQRCHEGKLYHKNKRKGIAGVVYHAIYDTFATVTSRKCHNITTLSSKSTLRSQSSVVYISYLALHSFYIKLTCADRHPR